MGFCFVIQPFDNGGPFDKRYRDTFKPAIEAADLEAYRVDNDPSAEIPIDEIHNRIKEATACLADITTNNPNVWYELGYAFAAGKPVVMVCGPGRERFPFDIQHRTVINYGTESKGDWDELAAQITQRLQAAIQRAGDIASVASAARMEDIEGLSQHEIVALVIVAENMDGPEDVVSASTVQNNMERVGYTKIATRIATERLVRKDMLTVRSGRDNNDNSYTVYQTTESGMYWLDSNEDKLRLRQEPRRDRRPITDDEIPF